MEKVLLTINTFSLVYCSWFSPKVHFLIDWGKVALSHKSSENKLMFTLRPVVSCVALFFLNEFLKGIQNQFLRNTLQSKILLMLQ